MRRMPSSAAPPTARTSPGARVVAAYAHTLWDAALATGLEPGVAQALWGRTQVGDADVPLPAYLALLQAAQQRGGATFAWQLGRQVRPTTYGVNGILLLACPTLGDALQQVLRFESLVHDLGRSAVRSDGDHVVYSWRNDCAAHPAAPALTESVFSGIHTCAQWLAGRSIGTYRAEFTHEGTSALARWIEQSDGLYDPQDYYAVPVSLDPEDVWNVEAGVSVQRPSWRLRGNVFWMHFLNEIVYAGAVDDNGVPVYGNGATSRHRGLEVDGRVTLPRRTSIDATLSLSRNTFTRYREFDFEGGAVTYDGNRIAGFPDVMASVVARTAIGNGQATLALRHVGRFYVDSSQRADRQNDAYTLADVSGRIPLPAAVARGIGLGRIEFDVRVNNLFDARYTTFGYVEEGTPLYIPAAGRHVYLGLTLGR